MGLQGVVESPIILIIFLLPASFILAGSLTFIFHLQKWQRKGTILTANRNGHDNKGKWVY